MKYEIKELVGNIQRITTVDERWYMKDSEETGVERIFVPSSTWICSYYPKGIAYFKWLAAKGWDEAESIKIAAGDKGSLVHQAIEELLQQHEVKIDAKFIVDGVDKEINVEEYECVMSFADWFKAVKPEVIHYEFTIWNTKYGYAGTLDLICKINGVVYVIDFKTSAYIWMSHKIQLSSYKHSDYVMKNYPDAKMAILQIGYRMNQKRYKFTEVDDCFDLFLSARTIWEAEVKDKQPSQKDFPLEITLKGE